MGEVKKRRLNRASTLSVNNGWKVIMENGRKKGRVRGAAKGENEVEENDKSEHTYL